jgi:hypothetical protein
MGTPTATARTPLVSASVGQDNVDRIFSALRIFVRRSTWIRDRDQRAGVRLATFRNGSLAARLGASNRPHESVRKARQWWDVTSPRLWLYGGFSAPADRDQP